MSRATTVFGAEALGDGGETGQVGEKQGDPAAFAPQVQLFRVIQEMGDDGLGHVLAEHAADVELLAALGGIAVGRGQDEAQAQGDPGQHRVGPPVGLEGLETPQYNDQQQQDQRRQGGPQPGREQDRQGDGDGYEQGNKPHQPERARPEKIPREEVVQQGGVDLHPGINRGQGGGLEVQEARGGEPHQDPLAGQVLRLVKRRQAVFQALLRRDDVGGRRGA